MSAPVFGIDWRDILAGASGAARARFAVLTAAAEWHRAKNGRRWLRWAGRWLDGTDRSERAARKTYDAVLRASYLYTDPGATYEATWAAIWAADVAAWAACIDAGYQPTAAESRVAWMGITWVADDATRAAQAGGDRPIDLAALARRAIEVER